MDEQSYRYQSQVGIGALGASSQMIPASRLEGDIDRAKRFASTIDEMAARINRLSHTLGYSEPTPPAPGKPASVALTLVDALAEIGRALDLALAALSHLE